MTSIRRDYLDLQYAATTQALLDSPCTQCTRMKAFGSTIAAWINSHAGRRWIKRSSVGLSSTGTTCTAKPDRGWCAGIGSLQTETMCVILRSCSDWEFEAVAMLSARRCQWGKMLSRTIVLTFRDKVYLQWWRPCCFSSPLRALTIAIARCSAYFLMFILSFSMYPFILPKGSCVSKPWAVLNDLRVIRWRRDVEAEYSAALECFAKQDFRCCEKCQGDAPFLLVWA